MKVTILSDETIREIGHAFGYYDYGGEPGLAELYDSPEGASTYICGFVRTKLKAGEMYTTSERQEGFTSFKTYLYDGSDARIRASDYGPLLKGVFASMGLKKIISSMKILTSGGKGLHDEYHKQKKPHIYVSMVVVREAFQHQGYMRRVMELSYSEGRRLGIPVILETDARSKRDRYVSVGMKTAKERRLSNGMMLYDMLWDPEEDKQNEKDNL